MSDLKPYNRRLFSWTHQAKRGVLLLLHMQCFRFFALTVTAYTDTLTPEYLVLEMTYAFHRSNVSWRGEMSLLPQSRLAACKEQYTTASRGDVIRISLM